MNKVEAKARLRVIKKEADELQRMIDAPEKPKLRHGDYGLWPVAKTPFIVNAHQRDRHGAAILDLLWPDGDLSNSWACEDPRLERAPILGNIFDDLERNQKNLTEFSVCSGSGWSPITAKLDSWGHILFTICGMNSSMTTIAKAQEFYQKLGQMIATMKRK